MPRYLDKKVTYRIEESFKFKIFVSISILFQVKIIFLFEFLLTLSQYPQHFIFINEIISFSMACSHFSLYFRVYLGFRNEDITGAYFEISTIDRFLLYIFRTSFSRWNLLPMAYTSITMIEVVPWYRLTELSKQKHPLSPGTSCNIFRRSHTSIRNINRTGKIEFPGSDKKQ